jgi:hypothetical protein
MGKVAGFAKRVDEQRAALEKGEIPAHATH